VLSFTLNANRFQQGWLYSYSCASPMQRLLRKVWLPSAIRALRGEVLLL
jgi:hypothetical protein